MTNERLKMVFGFLLTIGLIALAGMIGLGKVEEKTSFGLQYILGALAALSGSFAQWAFSTDHSKAPKAPPEKPDPGAK